MIQLKLWHKFIHPVTKHFRQKRGKFLKSTFPDITAWRICDLGGSRHFWEKIAIDGLPRKNITIYNISADETQGRVTASSNEIKIILYDGKKIPATDGEFDLLVCNSVFEHVLPEDRALLALEMKRVARYIFVQTPAYSFPIEPHFIMPFVHWLPRKLGFWLVHFSPWRLLSRPTPETISSYWWGTKLLTKREMQSLFPTESIQYEKFFGVTKSYYITSKNTD